MINRRIQLRSYKVIKPFVYAGVQFETGGVFDPKEFNCTVQKLERLVSCRNLDVAADVTEEDKKKKKKSPVAPVVAEVVEEPTMEPEQPVPLIVEEVPVEAQPQAESAVQAEEVAQVVVEETAVSTRARRRS